MRETVKKNRYDLMAEIAKEEYKQGRGAVLRTQKDIDDFFKNL